MTDDLLQFPLVGGVNETDDPRSLPPGTLIASMNVSYDQENSYGVRLGYTSLSASGPANILKLINYNSELLAIDAVSQIWGYDSQAKAYVEKDVLPAMGCVHSPLQNSTSAYESFASAVGYGYRVEAWHDTTTGPHAAIYSTTTGAMVLNSVLANQNSEGSGNLAHIVCGIINGYAIVLIAGATAIYYWQISLNPLGASWQNGAAISDGTYPAAGNTTIYCAAFLSDRLILAWEKITGSGPFTSYIECQSFTISSAFPSLITSSTTQIGTYDGGVTYTNWFGVLSMAATGLTGAAFWIAVATANNVAQGGSSTTTFTMAFNPTTLAALSSNSPPVVPVGIGNYIVTRLTISFLPNSTTQVVVSANGAGLLAMGPTGAGLGGGVALQELGINSAVSGVQTLYHCLAASQPIYVPSLGTHLMFLSHISQNTYYLVDLLTNLSWNVTASKGPLPRLLKILCPGIAAVSNYYDNGQANSPPIVQSSVSTQFETVLPVARTVGVVGLELFVIDLAANYRFSYATLGREVYIGDGYYDGASRIVETGFAYTPTLTANGSYSGTVGTWEYVASFIRVDAQGNEEESAFSPALQVSLNSTNPSFSVFVGCLTLSQKMRWSDNPEIFGTLGQSSSVYVCLYRTQMLQNGDTLHYRVAQIPLPSGYINNVQGYSLTISDSASDAAISVNTVAYQDSGELQHSPPESPTHQTSHMSRAYRIMADQRTIAFSQTYADGEVPAWNPSQTITVDSVGEPLIGLGSQYDRLYIFSANKIYVLFGDGPSVAGTGSSFQLPTPRVQSPVGCIDPRSLVETPLGVFFQSTRGLELIDGSGNVIQVGLPISVTTKTYPVCTSATYCPNTSTVRFTMTNAAGTSGILAVYDTRRQDPAAPGGIPGRWAIHQLTGETPVTAAPYAGAALMASCYHPVYGYVTAYQGGANNLTVTYQEKTTADVAPWLDTGGSGSYFVPLSVTLAWAQPGGLQGWASVRRIRALCTYYDAHGLTATIGYDYAPGVEVHAFNSNVVAGFVNGSVESVKYANAVCQVSAIQVQLTTTAPIAPQSLGTGRGASFNGVAFEVRARKGGSRRQPASAQS